MAAYQYIPVRIVSVGVEVKRGHFTSICITQTHTCRLLYTLKDVLGRDQEVQQALQGVAVVTLLDGAEELAEDDGRGGLEGREEGRQGALDG